MNPGARDNGRSCPGFFLIEYLIYIMVLAVVMGVAFGAFYRALDSSRALTRSSDRIVAALQAGEQWRRDIRQATAPPVRVEEGGIAALEIPVGDGRVAYVFADGGIWRTEGLANARLLLPRVLRSSMRHETRGSVGYWKWEIELQTRRTNVRTKPRFTFQAVPELQP